MTNVAIARPLTISQRIAAALVCLFVGSALVYGVGLAHATTAHNAAHDTRHAIGFPCH